MKPKLNADKTKEVKDYIDKWRAYWKYNTDNYHLMHIFVMGSQWNKEESDILKSYNKRPLQFNKLSTLVNTLLGEQQQNTPQLEIVPLSDCDQETAQIRQIVVKDIMLSTDAKTVYQNAAKQAFIGGFGAFIIGTDYTHEKSFDQDIVYRPIKDATHAYWDIGAEHPNKIDGMRCGYVSRMTRKKFVQVYGKDVEQTVLNESAGTGKAGSKTNADFSANVETTSNTDFNFFWADDNSITIIDDFERTYETDMLYKMSNGESLTQDELDEVIVNSREIIEQQIDMQNEMLQAQQAMSMGGDYGMTPQELPVAPPMEDIDRMALYMDGEPVRIEDKREYRRSKFTHRKMAGDYILDESEFPSEDCPVIFVDQNSFFDKNGKQVCRSFITDAVDAQRFMNYVGTQIAYLLKVSRYDQFIGSVENVRSPETVKIWKDPSKVQGMLKYDKASDGAKPEQLRPPELPVSLLQQYQRANEDLYTSTGLYPSRLGQEGNEISGAAIDARTRQGSYPTYVAFNAINMAITAGGQVVNQMIPRVYDTTRVMNLMFPDKGRQSVKVNEQQDEYGEAVRNDLRKGSFEVRLQAGPSYEGQKAEALQSLNLALQGNPQIFNLVADLYAENLPLSNTLEIKNRFKTLVPPEIVEAGKSGQMPEQAQQPSAQDQAAMAEAQYKMQKIELEKQKLQMEMQESQSKAQLEQQQMQLAYLENAAQLEQAKLRYMAEMQRTHSDNAISHADNITKLLINHTNQSMKTKERA